MSGDFNPDEVIKIIDKYFGSLKPNPNLTRLQFEAEPPIEKPIVKEVYGLESPSVTLSWRFPGINDVNNDKLQILSQVVYNGQAGLLDLNVNQQQKVLGSYGGSYGLADYSIFMLQGRPKQGQTLEQIEEILLAEIENVKQGNFDEKLLKAIVNNYKLELIKAAESNDGRVDAFVTSYIYDVPWKEMVNMVSNISKITKEDIVAFANENFKQNYSIVRKLEGKDPNELKISKPQITPIFTNRDTTSAFLREIQASVVKPIEPVFLDFSKDMSVLSAKSQIPVLYKQNTTNEIFQLTYLFEMGSNEDKALGTAASYLNYLGTSTMTPEEVKQAFYALACDFSINSTSEKTYVSLSGLAENMDEAVKLFESLLSDAQANPAALAGLKMDIIKGRQNAKLSQNQNFSRLQSYGVYGPKSPVTNILSVDELNAITDDVLLAKIKNLTSYEHTIMYYGPKSATEIVATLNTLHNTPEKLTPIEKNLSFNQQITKENSILIAPYDAKQIYMISLSNRGETYNPELVPIITMYNNYFGGGMNSIVFQEMREARGLAYSASATLGIPSNLRNNLIFTSFIATQNDKMMDALNAFDDIINSMPVSEPAFNITKESVIANLRTNRVIKSDILWSYLSAKERGLDYDINKNIFEKVQGFTLQDVVSFQQEWIKGRNYTICILGNAKDLDLKSLKKYGNIKMVSTQDIFGY